MVNYFKEVLIEKYADFNGRASRSEFWSFTLGYMLIFLALFLIIWLFWQNTEDYLIIMASTILLLYFALLIPSTAVTVRRLHDTDKSGWWYLIVFLPFGGLVLFFYMLAESKPGPNEYGPNPFELKTRDDISDHLLMDDLV